MDSLILREMRFWRGAIGSMWLRIGTDDVLGTDPPGFIRALGLLTERTVSFPRGGFSEWFENIFVRRIVGPNR